MNIVSFSGPLLERSLGLQRAGRPGDEARMNTHRLAAGTMYVLSLHNNTLWTKSARRRDEGVSTNPAC